MDVINIWIEFCNKCGKKVKKVKDIVKLVIGFIIVKNIIVEIGECIFYIWIIKLDNDVFIKSLLNIFFYENCMLIYFIKKYIEYNGEE